MKKIYLLAVLMLFASRVFSAVTQEQTTYILATMKLIGSGEIEAIQQMDIDALLRKQKQINDLQAYLKKNSIMSEDLEHLDINLTQLGSRLTEISEQIAQLQGRMITQERERANIFQQTIATMEHTQRQELARLQKEMGQQKSAYEGTIALLEKSTKEQRQALDEAADKLSHAAAREAEEKRKRIAAGDRSAQAMEDARKLEAQIKEFQGVNEALRDKKEEEIRDYNKQLQELEAQVRAAEEESANAQKETAKANAFVVALQNKISKKNSEVERLRKDVAHKEGHLKALNATLVKSGKAGRNTKGLEEQLSKLRSEMESDKRKLATAEESLLQAQGQLGKTKEDLQGAERKASFLNDAKEQLRDKRKGTEADLKDAQEASARMHKRIKMLQEQLEELGKETGDVVSTEAHIRELQTSEFKYEPIKKQYETLHGLYTVSVLDPDVKERVRNSITNNRRLTEEERTRLLRELDAEFTGDMHQEMIDVGRQLNNLGEQVRVARGRIKSDHTELKQQAAERKLGAQSMYQRWWSGSYDPKQLAPVEREELQSKEKTLALLEALKTYDYNVSEARKYSPDVFKAAMPVGMFVLEGAEEVAEPQLPSRAERMKQWIGRWFEPRRNLGEIIAQVQFEIEEEEKDEDS